MSARHLLVGFGVLLASGCGITQKQLDDLEAGISTQIDTKIAKAVADLERKITATDQKINATDAKYATMLALEQKVKNEVEKIDGHAALLEDSSKAWVEILQVQRNVLREQLKSVQDQIAGLNPVE